VARESNKKVLVNTPRSIHLKETNVNVSELLNEYAWASHVRGGANPRLEEGKNRGEIIVVHEKMHTTEAISREGTSEIREKSGRNPDWAKKFSVFLGRKRTRQGTQHCTESGRGKEGGRGERRKKKKKPYIRNQ